MKKILLICLSFLAINTMFSQKKNITLDDLWKHYSFFPKNYSSLNSMNNGEHYARLENSELGQELNVYKYKDGEKVRTLFKSDEFDLKRITNYSFSNDEKKLLLETQTEKIYRYSSRSIYYVYNIYTDKLKKISDDKLMFATFSHNGNKLAYVLDNNI